MFETVDFLQYSSMAMENTHRHSFTKCVPSKKKRGFSMKSQFPAINGLSYFNPKGF